MDKIGVKLKKIREKEGLSQKAFAEQLNIGPVTMNRLEKGGQMPDCQVLVSLRTIFGVDLNWLLNEDAHINIQTDGIPVLDAHQLSCDHEDIGCSSKINVPGSISADFAYKINNDEMFPLVRPGDYILVKKQEVLSGDLCLSETELGHIIVRKVSIVDHMKVITGLDNTIPVEKVTDNMKIIGRISNIVRCYEL